MIGHAQFGELVRAERTFKLDDKDYVVLRVAKDRWEVAVVDGDRVGHQMTDFAPQYLSQILGDAKLAAIVATFA